jgi:uncharacterized Rossmann fold enzyme
MNIEKWLSIYEEIVLDFDYSKDSDIESARLLNTFLGLPGLKRLDTLIHDRDVNVFGAGPSLEKLERVPDGVNIAADGACSFLLEIGTVPDILVTDLDGRIEDLIKADTEGALIMLHAQGDNISKVQRFAGVFKNLYGTTQTAPFGNLLNFGGFTDGDRAGYIAEHFKPAKITFYGMDFESEPGRYSFTPKESVLTKKKKLKWAKRLVDILINDSDVEIVMV